MYLGERLGLSKADRDSYFRRRVEGRIERSLDQLWVCSTGSIKRKWDGSCPEARFQRAILLTKSSSDGGDYGETRRADPCRSAHIQPQLWTVDGKDVGAFQR